MNKSIKKILITFTIIIIAQFIISYLFGGYEPIIDTGPAIWAPIILLLVVGGQVTMWLILLITGIRALIGKDFKTFGILVLIFLTIHLTASLIVSPFFVK